MAFPIRTALLAGEEIRKSGWSPELLPVAVNAGVCIRGEIRSLGNWEGGIQTQETRSLQCMSQNVGHDRA